MCLLYGGLVCTDLSGYVAKSVSTWQRNQVPVVYLGNGPVAEREIQLDVARSADFFRTWTYSKGQKE
jgi:hypothetical protein